MENKKSGISLWHLLRSYAWPLRRGISLIIPLTLITNFIVAMQPVVLSGVMSIIIGQQGTGAVQGNGKLLDLNNIGNRVISFLSQYSHDKWGILLILCGVFVFLVILSSIFDFLAFLLATRIEAKAIKLIQTDVMEHLLSLNISFFNHQKTGSLISRVTQDARNTGNGIGPLVRSLFHHTVLIIIYTGYLLSTNPLLTLIALALIIIHFGVTQVVKSPIARATRSYIDRNAEFSNLLHEIFTSIRVIKFFGGEKYERKRIEEGTDNFVRAYIKNNIVKQAQDPARSIFDALAMVGIVLIAAQQLIRGTLSIQGFALFIYVGQLLIVPINKFAVNISWIQALLASYSRIDEILKVKPKVIEGNIAKSDFNSGIEVRNISFSYGSGLVIKDISFEIKKTEIVAIVGPSGAGKSTLIDLILRFYDPIEGNVFIDAINLKEIRNDEYRKIFGVVPQQNILFNDTVKNNILYGRFDLKEEDVINAAKISNAHQFITELPLGYDTVVGERGVLLSGGQCQRLAIARAVVARPSVLVLDEATSSLDSDSERQVQTAIDQVLKNSTAIVIAHRLSTILHADKIIVLSKGSVEAIGKHDKLLEISPTYRRLYNLQFKDREKAGEKI